LIQHLISDEQSLKKHIRNILCSRERRVISRENLKDSAVLMPLAWNNGDPLVIVTKRSMNVEHHKGEISFPGGSVESEDKGLVCTALREAHEEIGLDPRDVDVLGLLDDHISIAGYHITPVVGAVPLPYDFRINRESDTILYVSLKQALGDTVWMAERSSFRGHGINIYFLQIEGGIVWGATARILKHFVDLISGTRISFSKVTPEVRAKIDDLLAAQAAYKANK
jgi:8-oxo-dGTP pyrophosphatase MutT (NUDIX family)